MSLVNIQDKFIVRAGTGGGISAPSNVTITNKSASGFTVSWGAVAGALGYKLDVSTDSGFGSFVTGYNAKDVAGTSQAVTGLTQNTTYYVRVRTVAAGSNSGAVSDTTETATLPLNAGLRNGLQAFYKLDDATDASGNGNTLTNNGGVTFSSGKIGNAAVFDGSNNLSLASLPNANCSETTVTFWFKDTSGAQERFLVSGGLSDSQFYIARASGDVKANFTNSGEKYCGGFGANDGNWHFFAARFTSTELKLQLDGTTSTYSGSYNSIQSSNSFRLGSNWDGTYIRLIGAMDAVGIWNRALTDSEIAELYNAGAGLE